MSAPVIATTPTRTTVRVPLSTAVEVIGVALLLGAEIHALRDKTKADTISANTRWLVGTECDPSLPETARTRWGRRVWLACWGYFAMWFGHHVATTTIRRASN